jgi:hypothetical protein
MWDWTAETWAAVGQVGTLVVAAVAALFARHQVLEARRTREEQAKPFVIVDFEPSLAGRIFIELVIRNIGTTIAKNVTMSFEPPLRSTLSTAEDKRFLNASTLMKNGIPTLPPGREYRMLFERMPDLKDNDELPHAYAATISYDDARGERQSLVSLLDLDIYFDLRRIHPNGLHEAVDALKALNETIAFWAQRGVDVRVQPVDEAES